MSNAQTPIGAALKGAIASLAGTIVLSTAMEQIPRLLDKLDKPVPKRGASSGVGGGKDSEKTVENLATKLADLTLNKRLNKDERKTGGQILHWAYGAGWGSFYGIMQSKLNLPHLLHGTLLAALMGITASTVIPTTKAAPWPKDLPPQRTALQLTYILFFSWTTALVYAILSRRK